jgi:hypothetical protein
VFDDFYAATAQVLPLLLLALMWDSGFLRRLRDQPRPLRRDDPNGVLFWTRPRVRAYAVFLSADLVVSDGVAILVLAHLLPDSFALRAFIAASVLVALSTLLTRLSVDVIQATAPGRPAPDPPAPRTAPPSVQRAP